MLLLIDCSDHRSLAARFYYGLIKVLGDFSTDSYRKIVFILLEHLEAELN